MDIRKFFSVQRPNRQAQISTSASGSAGPSSEAAIDVANGEQGGDSHSEHEEVPGAESKLSVSNDIGSPGNDAVSPVIPIKPNQPSNIEVIPKQILSKRTLSFQAKWFSLY